MDDVRVTVVDVPEVVALLTACRDVLVRMWGELSVADQEGLLGRMPAEERAVLAALRHSDPTAGQWMRVSTPSRPASARTSITTVEGFGVHVECQPVEVPSSGRWRSYVPGMKTVTLVQPGGPVVVIRCPPSQCDPVGALLRGECWVTA